jgi:hypothetical protein
MKEVRLFIGTQKKYELEMKLTFILRVLYTISLYTQEIVTALIGEE